MGNKGFDGTGRLYPNWSNTRTPLVMQTRKVKEYTELELVGKQGKKDCCKLRYTSEVAYSRNKIQDRTKGVVHFQNIFLLPFMHKWGHAQTNINQPLQKP